MNKINLNEIFSTVVLNPLNPNTNGEYIIEKAWTGMVKSTSIDENLIEDEVERLRLQKQIRNLEKMILEYRKNLFITEEFRNEDLKEDMNSTSKDIMISIIEMRNDYKIDMGILFIYLIKEYEKIQKTNPEELMSVEAGIIKQLDNFKKNKVFNFVEKFSEEQNRYIFTPVLTQYQEENIYNKDRETRNRKKLSKFLNTISEKGEPEEETLKKMNSYLTILDFHVMYPSIELGFFKVINSYQNYLLTKGIAKETIDSMSEEQIVNKFEELYYKEDQKSHIDRIKSIQDEILRYIDIDKLILMYLHKMLNSIGKGTTNANIFMGIMKETERIVQKTLKSKLISQKTKIDLKMAQGFSVESITCIMKNYCDGVLLIDEVKKQIIQFICYNMLKLDTFSDRVIKNLEFKQAELVLIANLDFNNLKRLYNLGKVDKKMIETMLQSVDYLKIEMGDIYDKVNYANEEFKYLGEENRKIILENLTNLLINLFESGIIGFSDLIKYYEEQIISIEQIDSLTESKTEEEKNNFIENLGKQIDLSILLEKYNEYIKSKIEYENQTEKTEKQKNEMETKRKAKDLELLLAKKYKMSLLTEDEKREKIEELIIQYCFEIAEEDQENINETLREMYKDGIINFEDIKKIDESYLKTLLIDVMLKRGELTLDDTNKLRESLTLNDAIGIVEAAFADDNINEDQRFILVMNMFHKDTKEDDEQRNKFLDRFRYTNYRGKNNMATGKDDATYTDDNEKKWKRKEVKESRQYVYPIFVKWIFFNALDKDAMITKYSNGYIEVNSKKLGVRIIEKYFEINGKTHKIKEESYGQRTFIISDEKFRENLANIIKEKEDGTREIDISFLKATVSKEDRISHNTQSQEKNWMRSMARYFSINLNIDIKELSENSVYSKEELTRLKDLVERYENAYVER